MELEAQGEEKEGEEHRENPQCLSLLMAHRHGPSTPARLPKTDGWEGFPSHPRRELAGNGVPLTYTQQLCAQTPLLVWDLGFKFTPQALQWLH